MEAQARPAPEIRASAPPAVEPLRDLIASHIVGAGNVRTLGKIGDRIDVLVSEDQITADEWSELTDMIAARHAELEPTEAAR